MTPRDSVSCRARQLLYFLAVLAVLHPPDASARETTDPRIVIHLRAAVAKNQCAPGSVSVSCRSLETRGDLFPAAYYAYLLVLDGDSEAGISGFECGISYDNQEHRGVDVYSWNACAVLALPSDRWPESGGGILLSWDPVTACQRHEPEGPGTGVMAIGGYFYLTSYSPDEISVSVRPNSGRAKVTGCDLVNHILVSSSGHLEPYPLGSARFAPGGDEYGYSPCPDAPPPSRNCDITGPATLAPHLPAEFGAVAIPGTTFEWTVAGDASIAGPNTGPNVEIVAEGPGYVTLELTTRLRGGTRNCQVLVPVVDPACPIVGSPTLPAGQAGDYVVTGDLAGRVVTWSATGNFTALIPLAPDGVRIHAGTTTDPVELTVEVSGPEGVLRCTRTIPIVGPTPVERTSWSKIKAFHRTGGVGQQARRPPSG